MDAAFFVSVDGKSLPSAAQIENFQVAISTKRKELSVPNKIMAPHLHMHGNLHFPVPDWFGAVPCCSCL
jgi:hypothetical protein